MIETKNNIVGSIKPKLNIAGKINKTIEYISPNNQEKSVIPTKEIQEITPDEKYNGLSKVIVDKIPDEYIIPKGEINITENGEVNVADKETAIVNVPEKKLGNKIIIKNGTYKAIDDNLDGYSEVEVATSGVDLNDYFKAETIDTNEISVGCWHKFIKKIPKLNLNITNTCYKMFYSCKAQEIDVSEFNTSNVINMEGMFWNCTSLTNLDLINFNTSNVSTMRYMFAGCSSLTNLDVSNFNTSNVTNIQSIFAGCSKLTSLDLSNFNTSKVTNMQFMFSVCSSLTSLDLSSFNTAKVTNMSYMFNGCSSLTNLDLSSFNTSNVTTMSWMFQNCSKLSNLNISNFDFTNVTSYSSMFANVPSNCLIIVKDDTAKTWITSKFTTLTNVKTVAEL